MIDAVHPWQAAAAIGATQANEAEDANDAGVKPTGCEARKEANEPFVGLVERRRVEQSVPPEPYYFKEHPTSIYAETNR